MTKSCLYVVFSGPADGKEAEYNEWYDHVHLRDLLRVPGIEKAQRFRIAPANDAAVIPAPYMAIYQLSDPAKAFAGIASRAGTPQLTSSAALNRASVRSHAMNIASGNYQEGAVAYLVALSDSVTIAELGREGVAVLKPSEAQARPGPQPASALLAALSSADAADEIAAIVGQLEPVVALIATPAGEPVTKDQI